MRAPNFALADQTGTVRNLSDYAGGWLAVYFYPKDDTPGCTTEACSFRDEYDYLQAIGLSVVGISRDSVSSHAKFAAKYDLRFPLLSDPDHAVISAYGAWGEKSMYGKTYEGITRLTVLVNPDGEIVKTYPKVTPKDHAVVIGRDLAGLRGSSEAAL
ncbi:thioredoxin-dependent thiol peroxidase [Candidatus Saccharibacteria bacterium]|nr:thioredoxin-dependent thiol peroxidase [Candidatus Saccharibacteria bacterium]